MRLINIYAVLFAIGFLLLTSCGNPDYRKLPLLNAAMSGNIEEVKTLLAAGAKVDGSDINGMQAIHWAVQYADPDIIKILIAAGAKADAKDNQGRQPIIYAVNMDNEKSVKVLLDAGAKIDVVDQNGLQPVHLAAHSDH